VRALFAAFLCVLHARISCLKSAANYLALRMLEVQINGALWACQVAANWPLRLRFTGVFGFLVGLHSISTSLCLNYLKELWLCNSI
jgi:hypothetical protein